MKRLLQRFMPLVLALGCYAPRPDAFAAQTFVTPRGEAQNVRFEQRADGLVHISYDLIASDMRGVFSVRLEASQDEGSTFDVTPQTITGDTGDGILPGPRKLIIWDSGKDVERLRLDRVRFRIVATGGPLKIEAPASLPAVVPVTPAQPVGQPAAKPNGGSKAKWLIPLIVAGAGGGAYAITAGGSSSTPPGTTTTAPTTTPTTTTTPPPPTTTTPATCEYVVSPLTLANAARGTSTEPVSVVTAAGCEWTATSNASFLSFSGSARVTGPGIVNLTIQANTTTSARTGNVTVAGQTVNVSQVGSGPDTLRITGFSPPFGSRITGVAITNTSGGVLVAVDYFLGSRERAYICALPIAAPGTCIPTLVTRGSGSTTVRMSVLPTANFPIRTTRFGVYLGDSPTVGSTTAFLSTFADGIFIWDGP